MAEVEDVDVAVVVQIGTGNAPTKDAYVILKALDAAHAAVVDVRIQEDALPVTANLPDGTDQLARPKRAD
jgi:hypothetical protein